MLKQFPPGYFALVMATGIVSIACHLSGLHLLALLLFYLNLVQYILCLGCSLYRLLRYPALVWQDLTHHQSGPAFLTAVAATNIVGVQCLLLVNAPFFIANGLWVFGGLLWGLIMYLMLAGVTLADNKPTLREGLNGTWLLCTVSSASVCVLGSYLAESYSNSEFILFFCVAAFMIGVMLYILIISQIFYRWLFLEMEPYALSPSYWINMGALAISTLAGARLLEAGGSSALIQNLHPFILGLSLFVGAFACWWIPFLLIVFLYRRIAYGIRIGYDLQSWSVVFPLGMFCAASFNILPLAGQNELLPVMDIFVVIALSVWAMSFIGLLRHLWRTSRTKAQS